MFTVKATYRGETRKFTLTDSNAFPSFHQLYLQLYRVFPISHNYYFSKLLFSPDSSKSRILLSREVRSADEYDRAITPYANRSWPNPLLKFSVYDETPHKLPVVYNTKSRSPKSSSNSTPRPVSFHSVSESSTSTFTPISFSHIPPPPIIFSSIPAAVSEGQLKAQFTPAQQTISPRPPPRVFSPSNKQPQPSVAELEEKLALVLSRMNELESRMNQVESSRSTAAPVSHMAASPASSPFADPPKMSSPATLYAPLCQYVFCLMCGMVKQGPWFECSTCFSKVCTDCKENRECYISCLGSDRPFGHHPWAKQLCPHCPTADPVPAASPRDGNVPMESPPAISIQFTPPAMPRNLSAAPTPEPQPSPASEPMPVAHFGIRCDGCQTLPVQGVRHKCLDCPDYDLCTECIGSGAAERHNPFHEFFEIKEPGRVVVHTVYSGNGERETNARRAPPAPEPPRAPEAAVHSATCNLCDSRIRGDRYKCMECPDFDTCERCFDITSEQHPNHGFVKIENPSQFVRRGLGDDTPRHHATCNSCNNWIYGVRYKCMHPECPDFDLCDDCEALPIAVHPPNHPLLKMRDVNTVIPTVYRVGQVNLIDRPDTLFGTPVVEAPLRQRSAEITSPELRPPSPFFYPRTESERSVSPPSPDFQGLHNDGRRIPSPLPISPPSPPMMIPGAMPREVPFWLPSPPTVHPSFMPIPQTNSLQSSTNVSPVPTPPPKPMMLQGLASPFFTPPLPPPPPSMLQFSPPPAILQQIPTSGLSSMFNATPERVPSPSSSFIARFPPLPPNDVPSLFTGFPNTPSTPVTPEDSQTRVSPAAAQDSEFRVQLPLSVPKNPFAGGFWGVEHLVKEEEESSFEKDLLRALQFTEENNSNQRKPEESGDLLNTPLVMDQWDECYPVSSTKSLGDILEDKKVDPTPVSASTSKPIPEFEPLLGATFVEDRTVLDGQVFPPGAEFVKSWCMMNSGNVEWSERTELVHVGGDSLGKDMQSLPVGKVGVSERVDVWTTELKAPEKEGRYVSYYRLKDGEGRAFGDSIWLDITVKESEEKRDSESSESMSSSSVIVMPRGAPETFPEVDNTDLISEVGSSTSSASLLSTPSEDSEYVVLYDSSSD